MGMLSRAVVVCAGVIACAGAGRAAAQAVIPEADRYIKLGTRKGAMSALMKPVVANLTDADIVDLVAYVSSREP